MGNELTEGPVTKSMLRFAVPIILGDLLQQCYNIADTVIFAGMFGIFLYNFFAALLRSLGNSVVPLIFLAVSAGLNIGLDLWFVAGLEWGVAGAAGATVISQYVSGIGIAVYTRVRFPELIRKEKGIRLRKERIREITGFSALTCLQQSIMNLGILADALGTGYYLFWKKKRH